VSYERLSPRQKQAVDLLFDYDRGPRNTISYLSEQMNLAPTTVKQLLSKSSAKYGIQSHLYIPSVRLVYLRAKELGML
jgi:hypothetical protein